MSITLKSSDDKIVIVDKAVALQLLTVKAVIEDCGADGEIPVLRVTREILEHVILYCTNHLELEGNNLPNWEAADYLNVPALQRLLCCIVVPLDGLKHGYHVVPLKERSLILGIILRRIRSEHRQHVVVFFSSKFSVVFHQRLLERTGVKCFAIYEGLPEWEIKCNILGLRFGGILLCTDAAVAHRSDICDVDLVIQFDPSYKEYKRRAALIEGSKGRSLLFLNPAELPLLKCLKAANVPLEGFAIDIQSILDNHYYLGANFSMAGIADGTCSILYKQDDLEFVVFANPPLSLFAVEAYKSYVLAYTSNAHRLDLQAVAASFGLSETPGLERSAGEERAAEYDKELIKMAADWEMVMKTD